MAPVECVSVEKTYLLRHLSSCIAYGCISELLSQALGTEVLRDIWKYPIRNRPATSLEHFQGSNGQECTAFLRREGSGNSGIVCHEEVRVDRKPRGKMQASSPLPLLCCLEPKRNVALIQFCRIPDQGLKTTCVVHEPN